MSNIEPIITRLSQHMARNLTKHRQAPSERNIPYVEGFLVIRIANRIFDYRCSFHLLSELKVMVWEQTLKVWDEKQRQRIPTLDPTTGQTCIHRVGMVYLTGKVTIELDGEE